MARTELTVNSIKGSYPGDISAGDLDISFEAGDDTNGNYYTSTGREIVMATNTGSSSNTITITSSNDPYLRDADISSYSISADSYMAIGPLQRTGWANGSGQVNIDVGAADIEIAIVRIPVQVSR